MTATSGNTREIASTINVTPMIDVLLVLLIIFMVIVPALSRGESTLVPQQARHEAKANPDTVVLEVLKGRDGIAGFRINQQAVAQADLSSRLAAIYQNRAERVLFVKGDDQLNFTQIAEVIDIGHAAGVDRIGLLTPGAQSGH